MLTIRRPAGLAFLCLCGSRPANQGSGPLPYEVLGKRNSYAYAWVKLCLWIRVCVRARLCYCMLSDCLSGVFWVCWLCYSVPDYLICLFWRSMLWLLNGKVFPYALFLPPSSPLLMCPPQLKSLLFGFCPTLASLASSFPPGLLFSYQRNF